MSEAGAGRMQKGNDHSNEVHTRSFFYRIFNFDLRFPPFISRAHPGGTRDARKFQRVTDHMKPP